ncbi:MAG: hypothetical protein PVF96_04455 [Candidatus Bathyarchaeota archaeon]
MLDTEDVMQLSLDLAGLKEIPEDTAIHVSGDNISNVLFGIDAGVPELLFAKEHGYDCVITHHPQGTAIINFHKVFRRHISQMIEAGVPKKAAEKTVMKKLRELEIQNHTRNYAHAVNFAKLLGMPYMNIHTPLDEVGRRRMIKKIQRGFVSKTTVQDLVNSLNELTEFQNAATEIKIRLGSPENLAGKVVVSHGAGTNGGYEIAKTYFEHGISTVIYIHIHPSDLEKLKADERGNLIVTGHIVSDSIGINPFINELGKRNVVVDRIDVIPG